VDDPLDIHRPGGSVGRLAFARDLIWYWLGLAGVMSALQFYLNPEAVEHTAIGRQLTGVIDDLWNISYGLGGLLILIGLITRRGTGEMIGLAFFVAGIVPNAVAIAVTTHGAGPSFFTILAVGFACGGRLYYLWHTTPRRHGALHRRA
jgi:hypothetical protein